MTAVQAPTVSTTLSFRGPGEPDHLDPLSAYTLRSGQLLRLLTRRLFGYRVAGAAGAAGAAAPAPDVALPVPDVALAVPTVDNGGLSEDGRTYRLRLRRGVFWDAQGAREMTAGDFVRGLKRVAHPTAGPARRYLTDTIAGMREYCAAYDAEFGGQHPTAPDFAQFHVAHDVAGLRAPDPQTVEIRLVEPANDFLHLLATGLAAAAPREYDYQLPDSPGLLRNAPSAGPYRIVRARSRDGDIVLEPNPRWDPRTDPIRERVVDGIRLVAADGDGAGGAGDYDVAWTFGTVSWAPSVDGRPLGYGLGPFLAVNLREPRGGRATDDPAVRRAIAHAVDRVAIRDIVAAPGHTAVVHHGLLLPGSTGHTAEARPAPPDSPPGGAMAAGTVVTLAIRDTERDRRIAAVLRENLAGYGIALEVRPGGLDAQGGLDARGARWDLALVDWTPDWYGNNGRTAVEPLLRGGAEPGAGNYGGYADPTVDRLLTDALREADPARVADRWRRVEEIVLRDLPVIPLVAHACGPCAAATDAVPRVTWTGVSWTG
jgi:peptide/nickel transport system substrate-binding protein